MLLRVVKAILVRVRSVPLGVLEPDFTQSVVDRPGNDVHLRERAAEMCDAATAGDEEGDEDDMCGLHAMVEKNPNRHEPRRPCTDLENRFRVEFRAALEIEETRSENANVPVRREERPMCLPRGVFRGCNWVV